MSENRVPGNPDPNALDGVLNELRDVLSHLPESEAPAPEAPSEFKLPLDESGFLPTSSDVRQRAGRARSRSRRVPFRFFEIISPPSLMSGAMTPVPRGIERAPESWELLAEDRGREVPPPVLDGVSPSRRADASLAASTGRRDRAGARSGGGDAGSDRGRAVDSRRAVGFGIASADSRNGRSPRVRRAGRAGRVGS